MLFIWRCHCEKWKCIGIPVSFLPTRHIKGWNPNHIRVILTFSHWVHRETYKNDGERVFARVAGQGMEWLLSERVSLD